MRKIFVGMRKMFNFTKNAKKKKHDELVQAIEELDQRCKAQIDKAVAQIKELDQEKIYYLCVETDEENLELIKGQLKAVKSRLRWTSPNILITNIKLKELSVADLKELLKTAEKLRG